MAEANVYVHVADLPEIRETLARASWRISCLEAMLVRPTCSQCGQEWLTLACGPTHAAIKATHPLFTADHDLAAKLGGVVVGTRQEDGSWTCECGQSFRHDVALYAHRQSDHRPGLTRPSP